MGRASSSKRLSYRKGLAAEALCRFWLFFCGYRFLASRFKTGLGEVDLIAFKGNTVVFVEVKARPTIDAAIEAVLPKQRERIRKAASAFLARNSKFSGCSARFDVFAVVPWRCPRHIVGAWD